MKTRTSLFILCGLALYASCSKDDNPDPQAGTPVDNVQLATTSSLGNILTDSAGRSLYFFSIDANGTSGCTGDCAVHWPAFYTDSLRLASGLTDTDFAVITRTDGAKQITYKGWPLYYYSGDAKAGDINGDNLGSVWFTAKPDYTVMLAQTQLVGNDGKSYDSTITEGVSNTLYITDDWGRTLYAFSPDSFNVNKFTKSDFSNNSFWPIYEGSSVDRVPSALTASDFATTTVYGKTQITYRGWPMYHFGPDAMIRGKTLGVSVPQPGVWPVMLRSSPEAPKQ